MREISSHYHTEGQDPTVGMLVTLSEACTCGPVNSVPLKLLNHQDLLLSDSNQVCFWV